MTPFDTAQKEIWESTKRQAALVGLCKKGCDWQSDDGVCVSSTGCMYKQSQEVICTIMAA